MGKRKRSSKQSSGDIVINAIVETDRISELHKDNVIITTNKKNNKKVKSKKVSEDTSEQGDISTDLQNDSKPETIKTKSKKLDSQFIEEDNQTEEASIPTKAKKVSKKHVAGDSDTNAKEESIKKKKNQIKPVQKSSIETKTGKLKSTDTVKASKGNNKQSSSNSNTEVKNKKIIFADDGEQQVEISSTKKGDRSKSFLNEEEADVNDEDIDKFCDELGDDDNVQYENWVQLIEAKLHSGSKKGK